MSIKHQIDCYRTIKGEKYVNWCDVLGPEHELIVSRIKARNVPHRIFRHPDGFRRLFVKETATALACEAQNKPCAWER